MKPAANGFGSTAGAAMLLMAFAATTTHTDSTLWAAFASRWTGRQAVLQHAIYDVGFSPQRSKGSTALECSCLARQVSSNWPPLRSTRAASATACAGLSA